MVERFLGVEEVASSNLVVPTILHIRLSIFSAVFFCGGSMKKIGLYIHIPFCEKKCHYCDFYSITNKKYIDAYINALTKEIEKTDKEIFSVYIGGGSPSILEISEITKIFAALNKINLSKCEEISIEANPSQITAQKLERWLKLGIRRISIGAQSFSDKLLKNAGRIHTAKMAEESVILAKEAGFKNISLDLMYGLPFETLSDLKADIDKAASLSPTHISAYSLMLEKNTPLIKLLNENKLTLPDDETVEEMYDTVNEFIPKYQYGRYEVSNFAKVGYECKHNLLYWSNGDYIGVGASAASFIGGVRYKNNCSIEEYIYKINNNLEVNSIEERTKKDAIFEYIFLALRKTDGLNAEDFQKNFNMDFESVFKKELSELKKLNLLVKQKNQFSLTEKGFKLSNMVFEKFILQ